MVKYVVGKFGRNAIAEIKRKIHLDRVRYGKLPHINAREEKQIFERAEKVFGKNGKMPNKIRGRELEKEVLNPLSVRMDDYLDTKEVKEIDKDVYNIFGLTEHTKQVGSKYFSIVKQEKRLAAKKRFEELKTEKNAKDANVKKIEKTLKPSRLETLQKQIKEPRTSLEILNNKITGDTFKLGISNKKISESGKNTDTREASGFKKQLLKSGGIYRVGAAPIISDDFSGMGLRKNKPPDSDWEYGGVMSERPQNSLDNGANEKIPSWKLEAYGPENPADLTKSPEAPISPPPSAPQHDIDE